MHYQSPLQTPEDDLVDERWDTNLGFYSSDSSLKEQPVALYKNTNIRYNDNNNQVSPPCSISSVSSKKINGLNTVFFREDVSCDDEDKDYFQGAIPTIVVDLASALPTPSVSECSESLEPSRVDKDQEDFPIISLNELTPNDCATVLEQQEIESYLEKPFEYKQLHSIESYHLDQVQHYLEIVMRITDPSIVPPEVLQALPDVYVKYIQDIREAVYVD